MNRFSDNDLIQEYFEMLVSSGAKDFQPTFLLDDDLTVKWANDAAHRRFPSFTEPEGIIEILCGYEEEKEKLVSENKDAKIALDSCSKLRIYSHTIGGGFKIYKGVISEQMDLISEQVDLDAMSNEEAERYLTQFDIDIRRRMLKNLLNMRLQPDRFAEIPELGQMYDAVIQALLQTYRQSRLICIGQLLSRGILEHLLRRIDLRDFVYKVFNYADNLLTVFAGSELLCSVPTARVIVDTEPDYILTVLAQLFSNAVKYRAGSTPIQASLILRENSAEILIINGKAEHCSNSIEYRIGLHTAAKLAEFIGGSLTYQMDRYQIVFRFTIPTRLDRKRVAAERWTMEDELEMKAQFCVDLCDALPTHQELMMLL